MVFMLIVTLTSLALTAQAKVSAIMTSGVALAPVVQLLLAILLFVLAIVLAVKAIKHIASTAKAQK